MKRTASYYARKLYFANMTRRTLRQAKDLIDENPQLRMKLENPDISPVEKNSIIEKEFPEEISSFLKRLCSSGDFELFDDIYVDFCENEKKEKFTEQWATLVCVTPPTKEQLAGIKKFLDKEFGNDDIEIIIKRDASLKSGFILRVGNTEYDWSESGRIAQFKEKVEKAGIFEKQELEKFSSKDFSEDTIDEKRTEITDSIISILRTKIDEFELQSKDKEIGVVSWVGDGIANIDGIEHAFYGEIVIFDCGVKGMVQDVRSDEIGVILFGRDAEIKEGTRVVRTGKMAGISVGEDYKGRIIDALGNPIDGKGDIKAEDFRPLEYPAPGIVDRKSVSVPMETGILAIDSMFPIGRGQRELIIGDRQTGKTSIAMDTIINQRGKNVVCIYVAIGQKSSTIAKLVNKLTEAGSMDYTIIVSATASDPAPLQYIAPYSGTALAEFFMYQGRDVLIVYDDLSKHAVAYRAISLLLERPPGREAYPGDVFYLHSRLLERSSRLSPELGGGSITALPIIETQAGDVSAYIPTNVISITDGQIYLESELFFSGQRPAVNVGLSVSRVGGAAQTKAMKKAAGSIRIDLAQYREMEVFTQFSSDLDESTRLQLTHGRALMELFKQPRVSPLSMAEQVITLVLANAHIFSDLPEDEIKEYQRTLINEIKINHAEIIGYIEADKDLSETTKTAIIEIAANYMNENRE